MRITPIIQAAAVLLLASCNTLTTTCTLIGCEDGLMVRLNGTPSGAYRVEAWSEIKVNPRTFECGAGETCPPVFFPQFQGENVTVRVTTAAGTRTLEFTGVQYESLYPNGRRCGAACQQASITVEV